MRPKRVAIASSGSEKSLHLGGGSAPLAANLRLGRSQPASGACASADLLGAHALEEIVLRIVLADMVEAQEPPAPGPSKLAGWSGALNSPGAPQPGTAQCALAPSTRPCNLGLLRCHAEPSLYKGNERSAKPVRSRLKCFAGSIRRLSPTRHRAGRRQRAHRGHGGYNPAGESHFTLRIESPAFAGKSRVERQRMVYAALGDLMHERVHALSIRATAPGEVMMATIETAFEQVITPVTHDLGDFKVNRTLPARERTMVGPFIFVDEFGPARLPAGPGHGRSAASAHQSRDRHLSVRGRDRASRQHRQPRGDRARSDQPDDGRQRHRPFGALAASAARDRPEPLRHADLDCASRRRRRDRAGVRPRARGRPSGPRGCRRARARPHGHLVGRDRGDPQRFAHHLRRHRADRRVDADRRRSRRAGGDAGRRARPSSTARRSSRSRSTCFVPGMRRACRARAAAGSC